MLKNNSPGGSTDAAMQRIAEHTRVFVCESRCTCLIKPERYIHLSYIELTYIELNTTITEQVATVMLTPGRIVPKLPLLLQGYALPSNTWFLSVTGVHIFDGGSIGSGVSAGLTNVCNRPKQTDRPTDRQTDHAATCVAVNGILCYAYSDAVAQTGVIIMLISG